MKPSARTNIALFASLVCLLQAASAAPIPEHELPPPEKSPYGVCQRVYYDKLLRKFREAGIQWITFGAEWNAHEQREGEIVWNVEQHSMAKIDIYLPVLARNKMASLMLIVHTPRWAQEKARAARPDSPSYRWNVLIDDYVSFLKRFLGHCAEIGVVPGAFMITNESPTGGNFYSRDPLNWVEFYKASYALVKRRFPDVPVLMDGMWGVDMHHLEELYELGLNEYFDVANFHYYAEETNEAQSIGWEGLPGWSRYITPVPTQVNINDLGFQLEYMHHVMKRFGDVKPIWITECGWREQTEGQKAQYMIDTLDICRRSGLVERFFWYVGSERDHMSLFHDPGYTKYDEGFEERWEKGVAPAYHAYQAYARKHPTWPMKHTVVNHIPPATKPLVIPDSGFEEPGTWEGVIYDEEVKRSGKCSARLDSDAKRPVSSAELSVRCEEQRAYLLTGWMRVKEDRTKDEPDERKPWEVFHAMFDVWMHTWARKGPAIGNYFVADTSRYPDGGWRRVSVPIVTTPGSNRVTVKLSSWFGPGTVWFDDLKIEPLGVPHVPRDEKWAVP